ncbi:MAG: nuclease [Lentisphaerae bacterium]|nr:nuclease [Lentisphaerota bacterium]
MSVLYPAFRVFLLPKLKGYLGEASINFWAKRLLDQSAYHLIPNVILPTPDGTTQIDHVIVSRYGIFVLETKTYKGWIYGDEREAQWTQVNFKRKDRFQNPLRQNYKHTKTLAELTGIPAECFKSLVVFVGDCTFKTDMPANVVYVGDFVRYIKGFQTPIIKDEQVSEIVSVIGEWAGTVTDKQKAGHIAHVREKKAPVSADAPAPACPRCGTTMTLRTSRKDGGQFWGCPKYPACRGTRPAT